MSATSNSGVASAPPMTPAPRASRRSRKVVKYYDTDDEDFVDEDDNVYAIEPPSKKQKLENSEAAAAAQPPAKKNIFPFMSLPPEIRNNIYKMALFDPAGHHLVKHRAAWRRGAVRVSPKNFKELNVNWWARRRRHRRWWQTDSEIQVSDDEVPSYVRLSSRILRICRAMYDEAIGILYSQPITLTDTYALHDFMVQIGPKHRALLRDVEVCEWGSGGAHGAMNFPAMATMADAVNLERIKLNVNKWGSSELALRVWRECYPFLEAFGRANGRKDAVVDILELYDSQFKRVTHTWTSTGCEHHELPEDEERERFQKLLRRMLITGQA
ncbi:hypothetical protein BLS_000178 [Venturia inaequalis]|uniref:DUF7730 domain-containing protein n=1 Tax=Venturia inaequalis TaxID=5025 RepID=A0A8H3YK09_VENIN|nr:hypothetical protein BLS_000178 [Venturia inaequalis]KAE9973985.1 hypothetical protein EG327_008924 [Venturia inaequalis]RDI84386.1 hypothetical protein Vi05172_g5642 [Venturia inaequalis]